MANGTYSSRVIETSVIVGSVSVAELNLSTTASNRQSSESRIACPQRHSITENISSACSKNTHDYSQSFSFQLHTLITPFLSKSNMLNNISNICAVVPRTMIEKIARKLSNSTAFLWSGSNTYFSINRGKLKVLEGMVYSLKICPGCFV